MEPILPLKSAEVFFDGIFAEPRLQHPEGIAVDAAGHVWCGSENGEILRIAPDGTGIQRMATTDGFILGVAFDAEGRLYACDLKHQAVFRYDTGTGQLDSFATGMKIPNYPVVDVRRGCLYVSDSHHFSDPGPGVWRFDLASGAGGLWYDQAMVFANGMALSADGNTLYVCETFGRRVSQIPIGEDGTPGEAQVFVEGLAELPDGLAFDTDGSLYISCYEPSRVLRATPDGAIALFVDDPDAHTLCHPTNCAFRGSTLYTTNLGRWHITAIKTQASGLRLPVGA